MNNNDFEEIETLEVENENNKDSKEVMLSVLAIAILVVIVLGITYAAFQYSKKGNKENTVNTGTMKMDYTEGENGISITNAMPVNDEVGKAITPTDAGDAGTVADGASGVFDFTVSATISGNSSINYEIAAIKQTIETSDSLGALENNEVKLYLEKDATEGETYDTVAMEPKEYTPISGASAIGSPDGSMILESGTIEKTQTVKYRLRMWVDENYEVTGIPEQFKVKVNVYGKA